MDKADIISNSLIVIAIIMIGVLLYITRPDLPFNIKPVPQSELEITNDCQDLNLKKTSYCFRNNIDKIFKYELTNDSIDLTFDELVDKGGDCRNWALLYESLCEQTDYYCKYVSVMNKIKTGHAFLIMSGEDGYCVLDQININCVLVKKK